MDTSLRSRFELDVGPSDAFERVADDLVAALERRGIALKPGPGGRLTYRGDEVGRVVDWRPGERIALDWRVAEPADRSPEIEVTFHGGEAGTRVTFEVRDWAAAMGPFADASGWSASEIMAPLLQALTVPRIVDWVTDRAARRPSGPGARTTYRDPLYHYPAFRVTLAELALEPGDVLLDVGCGGGALLRDALKSGCRGAGIDHSIEMVRVARDANRADVAAGRLQVIQARADRLPFAPGTFTRASLTGVLGFLEDPVACLREVRNALAPGGRLVMLGSDPRLRGTPAAPEPIASRIRFYNDEELAALGLAAGFDDVTIARRNLAVHARAVGIPDAHVPLYEGETAFLLASIRRR